MIATKTKNKVLVGVVFFAALTPCLLLLGGVRFDSIREYLHRTRFDGVAWQDPKQGNGDDPIRIRMVDDLIASKRLDGHSRSEIEALLGPPTHIDRFKETVYDYYYWLGPERRLIGIDSEWLMVYFDGNGKVSRYELTNF